VSVSVSLTVAGEKVLLSLNKGKILVSGASNETARSLTAIAEEALAEYSPAMGGKGFYIASVMSKQVGATIESVNEPPSEKGVVY